MVGWLGSCLGTRDFLGIGTGTGRTLDVTEDCMRTFALPRSYPVVNGTEEDTNFGKSCNVSFWFILSWVTLGDFSCYSGSFSRGSL